MSVRADKRGMTGRCENATSARGRWCWQGVLDLVGVSAVRNNKGVRVASHKVTRPKGYDQLSWFDE
jgi:hypothetical protein